MYVYSQTQQCIFCLSGW